MLIALNESDWEIIHHTAYSRDAAHRLAGVFRAPLKANYGDPTTVRADLQGVIGEYAVHKLFSVPFKDDTTQLSNSYDILLPSRHRGECKYVNKAHYRFGLHENQRHHFHTWDVGILVTPSINGDIYSDPLVSLCISHNTFWRLQQSCELGWGGVSYMVQQDRMTPIATLIEFEQNYESEDVPYNSSGTMSYLRI